MAKEINLKELYMVIRKRLWVIVVTTILATLAGYIFTIVFKPMPLYQSSTRLIVKADDNNMSTLMVMMKDPTVLEKISDRLNNVRSPAALSSEITASKVDSSQVVSISVTDRDPRLAATIANTTADVFKNEAKLILHFTNIQLLSEAQIHPRPINAGGSNKIILAMFAGLVLGVGLVFFLNSLDDTIQTESELEKLFEVPVLGSISKMNKKNMYKRRKSQSLGKDIIELTSIWKIGTKKGKLAYKKPIRGKKDQPAALKNRELTYSSPNSVQRVHH